MAYKEGFANGTRAAAAGGVTTVLVMPTDKPITFTAEQFSAKREMAEGICCVDFGLAAAVSLDSTVVPILAELGALSFEIFLADSNSSLRVDSSTLLRALESIHEIGGTAGITPGDHTMVEERRGILRQSGAKIPRDYPRAYPPVAEAMGLARGAAAALNVGSTTVFRQTSCRSSVEILRALKQIRGACLYAEVNPHYLFLTEDALEQIGPFAVMSPPLRSSDDVSALWSGLSDGTLDFISTDHAPHLPAEKEKGLTDIWETPMGIPGLQTMLPLMLQAAKDGVCSYTNVASWCATTPAKLFGLYPKKGCIAQGADADLVIVDTSRLEMINDREQYTLAKRTPFAGRLNGGAIDFVFLRGQVICRDGVIVGSPSGQFLRRC
jgi:dihydroorotase